MRDQAEALLRAYRPSDPREREHQSDMLTLLEGAAERAFARDHWSPGHFTASAFVLSPRRDALLLIHHRKLDRWLQPGGHIEPGDASALDAALREAREEVGLHPTSLDVTPALFDLDIHAIPARKSEPGHQHFDLRFLFVAQEHRFSAGEEVKDAAWFPLTRLRDEAIDESVGRAVRKLVAARQ